ncbi:hypothetical protein FA95DRAFT_1579714 [Auriscalpium vulgare]|uniref:Uncharacterized protein n=1 Tax=Auriscalpium vulgare TaxID=40419 RepID=A0ACB8SB39_9AGAM|nr:hypothetical protein FA95DRAFT_1579714 [Auriscalpium vulgare]
MPSPYADAIRCDWTSAASSPVVGLFPDFNMHEMASNAPFVSFGINPADLFALTAETVKATPDVLASLAVEKQLAANAHRSAPATRGRSPCPQPHTANTSASPPTCRPKLIKTEEPRLSCLPPPNAVRFGPAETCGTSVLPSSPLRLITSTVNKIPPSPDTPVFDPHLGVDLADLQRRAHRYRRHYPGQEISRQWLLSYAGNVNRDGASTRTFRCYVSGCTQTNKRKDHIAVHVGSHVGERPFRCGHCDMAFLRRNECKRHEANHLGLKPYFCDRCTAEVRFGRQDLLTRHLKRVHGIAAGARTRYILFPLVGRSGIESYFEAAGGAPPPLRMSRVTGPGILDTRSVIPLSFA